MSRKVAPEALLDAARRHRRPGINARVALVLAYAELEGNRLDPEAFDDAAVILRAERLLMDDVPVVLALAAAREELVTFAEGER